MTPDFTECKQEPCFKRPQRNVHLAQLFGDELVSLRSPLSATAVELPRRCTLTLTSPCDLLARLPALNEVLVAIAAEVNEVAFEKVAVGLQDTFLIHRDWDDEFVDQAAFTLHCLLSYHHCVEVLDVKNIPRTSTIEPMIWDALQSNSWLTSLQLEEWEFCDERTSTFLSAICHLLQKQLRHLSLKDVILEDVTLAMLEALKKALGETRTLRTLSVYRVGDSDCGDLKEPLHPDLLVEQAFLDGLAANESVTSFAFLLCRPPGDCVVGIRRLLKSTATLVELTLSLWHQHERHFRIRDIFEALAANRTVIKLTLKDLFMRPRRAMLLAKLLDCNSTLQDVSYFTIETDILASPAGTQLWELRELTKFSRKVSTTIFIKYLPGSKVLDFLEL
ncbi:hypothetical protein HPB49_010566 [Dermacentor silvarum]|uniref:Uncharacterized protein n=1 Tax=Dermacentor silvarum TaxID=543639 RepID=A0ACB8DZC1_DERSI|nr:hypothetical protein HPB49_010566 [Dermacentor silvarum]